MNKNWLEWCVFGVSLILIAGTVGSLIYDATTQETGPPRVEVTLGEPVEQPAHYLVPLTIHNRGGHTAENVQVRVWLQLPGQEPETAEFSVPYVPRESNRSGAVTFTSDPAQGILTARAVGYETP